AEEPMIPDPNPELLARAAKFFPVHALNIMADRLGDELTPVLEQAEKDAEKASKLKDEEIGDYLGNPLICECELVSWAEIEQIAKDPATKSLTDIRLRTRLGMGTCQGAFCAVRCVGALAQHGIELEATPTESVRKFIQERWKGARPALWGVQAREMDLGRAIYAGLLNLDGATHEQKN
nr:(2Fe-2S)-binding protein [Desulfovibrio sp.]